MAEAPLIDRAHLAEQTGGDGALTHELLGLFRAQCERLLPGIADDGSPFVDRADLAHTLKGSALGIGAGPVAACAGRIEEAFRAGEVPPVDAIAELTRIVEATLAEVASRS